MNEFSCPACPWIVAIVVVAAFAWLLWRNRRERITRMDLRGEDKMGDALDRARRGGL